MGDAAAQITLVSIEVDEPVVFPDKGAFGRVTLSGPAPAGLSIAVTSSNPHVLSVDSPTVDGDTGTNQSFLILLTPQALGTAVITATLGNSVQTEVVVTKNPKEGKEGKDHKDTPKDKEGAKDLEIALSHGSGAMINAEKYGCAMDGYFSPGASTSLRCSHAPPALRLRDHLQKIATPVRVGAE